MQNYFSSSFHKTQISNILFEINKSKVRNEPIYIINYDLSPWSKNKKDEAVNNKIYQALTNISNKKFFVKKQDSAFSCCDYYFVNNNIYKLKFCGVNTNACIKDTALDFHKLKEYNVNVLDRCCFCGDFDYHKMAINSMKRAGINILKGGKYDISY